MHPSDAAYAGAHDVARQSHGVASVCPDAKTDTATNLKAHALAGRHPGAGPALRVRADGKCRAALSLPRRGRLLGQRAPVP